MGTHAAETDTLESYRERIGSLKTHIENESKKTFERQEKIAALEEQLKEAKKNKEENLSSGTQMNSLRREMEEERQLRISKEIEISKLKQEFEHVKVGMEKGFLALTKQLNPADVFKQAGDANSWEINRLRATVAELEEKLAAVRCSAVNGSGHMSPASQRRREELLHQEVKRLRGELEKERSYRPESRGAESAGGRIGGEKPGVETALRDENEELQDEINKGKDRLSELEIRNRQLELQAERPNFDGEDSVYFFA